MLLAIQLTALDNELVEGKNNLLHTLSMHQRKVSELLRIRSKNTKIISGLGKMF